MQANQIIRPSQAFLSNSWVPVAQWLAVLTMTGEHVTKYVWPESPFIPWMLAIGRIAFPVFAGMVAWHLFHNTRRPTIYGFRLLVIGAISQVPYSFVVTTEQLNICFTLAFGLFVVVIMNKADGQFLKLITGILIFLIAAVASTFFEYQILGLFLVPAFVYAFSHHNRKMEMVPALALCAVINGGAPLHMAISFAAGCAVLLAPSMATQKAIVPAVPRGLRQAWYPLHLAAIAFIMIAANTGVSQS